MLLWLLPAAAQKVVKNLEDHLSYPSDGDAEPEPERMRPFLYEPVVSDDDESSEASVDFSW